MADPKALYQEVILDHNRKPRNYGTLADASHHANGHNPLCGDQITMALRLDDGKVGAIAFEGESCAICKASASMMTTTVKGKPLAEVRVLFDRFHQVVTGKVSITGDDKKEARKALGCLSAFAGVSAFPIRVKCATLAWHAMMKAVEDGTGGRPDAV